MNGWTSVKAWIRRAVQVIIAIVYFLPFYWMFLKSFRSSIFPPHFPPLICYRW